MASPQSFTAATHVRGKSRNIICNLDSVDLMSLSAYSSAFSGVKLYRCTPNGPYSDCTEQHKRWVSSDSGCCPHCSTRTKCSLNTHCSVVLCRSASSVSSSVSLTLDAGLERPPAAPPTRL